jgi:protein deglycase
MLNRIDAFIFLATGFEETEAIATIDVLRRGKVSLSVISVTGEVMVTGSHGITVQADLLFEEADFSHGQLLILPGGMPGTKNLQAHAGLISLLTSHYQAGKWLAAICAAPKILGCLGFLQNKTAICYPGYETDLQGAILSETPVVSDGTIITGKAAGYTIDFALRLVEVLKGKDAADRVVNGMFPAE